MANPYIGWVNLQMVSVRHHLSLLLEAKNANERLRNRGVLESAAWHMLRAYRYYLFELGANYQLSSPEDHQTADELGRALESAGKHPGEASELIGLEDNGWVSDLLGVNIAINRPSPALGGPTLQKELAIIDLDRVPVELTQDVLIDWLSKFKELTERHREVMVEY